MERAPVIPNTLHARFFGATTIQIDDGEKAIMVDGFFSRPGLARLAMSWLAPALFPLLPNNDRIDDALNGREQEELIAVLVAHSHHDHAMDSAAVAKRRRARLVGSLSTANIAHSWNFPKGRIDTPDCGKEHPYGPFKVQFFMPPHSPDPWYPGEITEVKKAPKGIRDFKEGGSYSFLIRHQKGTILIHPSANFKPGQYKGIEADVVFLGIGQLGKQEEGFARQYWCEVVRTTHAKLVIPIHWDDFFRPLDEPLVPMPNFADDFEAGAKILLGMATDDGIPVRFLPKFDSFNVGRDTLPATSNESVECK